MTSYPDVSADRFGDLVYAPAEWDARPARSTRNPWFLTLLMCLWGASSTIALGFAEVPHFLMGAMVIAVAVLLVVYFRNLTPLLAVLSDRGAFLMALHATAAVLSTLMAGFHITVFRFVLLAAGFSLIVSVRDAGFEAWRAARRGFTWAGMFIVLAHLPLMVSVGQAIWNPHYRITLFLNPNAAAFIATMTAVSLAEYVMARAARADWGIRTLLLLAGTVVALLLVIATKSRTAAIVLVVAFTVLAALRLRWWVVASFALLGFPTLILASTFVDSIGRQVSVLYRIDDRIRQTDQWSGRLEAWQEILNDFFFRNPLFGAGPGSILQRLGSAHNGLLFNLGEVGLAGTVPLLIILALAGIGAVRCRKDRRMHAAIALYAAGVVESMGESAFFSIGNPGSLLFVLATVLLLKPPAPEAVAPAGRLTDESYAGEAGGPGGYESGYTAGGTPVRDDGEWADWGDGRAVSSRYDEWDQSGYGADTRPGGQG